MQNPLPPGPHFAPPLSAIAAPIQFEGKKKKSKPMDTDSQRLERRLLEQGVSGASLWEAFRVKLWNIRQLKGKALLKVDASANPKVSMKDLVAFFEEKLGQPVIVKDKGTKSCCGDACKGCLMDRADKRPTWRLDRKG